MDPTEWPYQCKACQVTIPNPISWTAHKTGKKHTIKSTEYLRRQEENDRTVHVSGPITTTPVAELLLRNYFEDNFGTVEKVVPQEKYVFVIFESPEIAKDCVREKRHEFDEYVVFVKPRSSSIKAHVTGNEALRRQLNACQTFSDQLVIINESFSAPTDQFKQGIDQLFLSVTNRLKETFNLSFELIGSVRCALLMSTSDVDISLQIEKCGARQLDAELKALGEKTVRNPGHPSRVIRDITDILYVVTGTLVRLAHEHGYGFYIKIFFY